MTAPSSCVSSRAPLPEHTLPDGYFGFSLISPVADRGDHDGGRIHVGGAHFGPQALGLFLV
jgi:hypothetical protein